MNSKESKAPPAPPPPLAPATEAGEIGHGSPSPDATGGVIPYRNPAALIAYYAGIFGLIPFIGLPAAVAAVILGIVGLGRRKRQLAYGGLVHAWIGIVLGVASLGYHVAGVVLLFVL